MAALTIDGTTMPVARNSWSVEDEDLRGEFQFWDSSWGSEIRGDNTTLRNVSWQTPPMSAADADGWVAVFESSGFRSFAGDLIGTAADFDVAGWDRDDLPQDRSRLAIRAREVGA